VYQNAAENPVKPRGGKGVVRSLSAQLLAFSRTCAAGTKLFNPLHLDPADGYTPSEPGTVPSLTVSIDFALVRLEDFNGTTEGHEEFFAEFGRRLLQIAAWLDSRPTGAFAACREASLELMMGIAAEVDEDQFEVVLPPSFLAACARAELPIRIDTELYRVEASR
jgi:hypothetical protein